jgi:hypothetical protein
VDKRSQNSQAGVPPGFSPASAVELLEPGRCRLGEGVEDQLAAAAKIGSKERASTTAAKELRFSSQIEQREGRIVRQGNQHDEVGLYAFATLGSLDATMWQNNERRPA